LEANERDVARAEANGTSAALIDRLRLTGPHRRHGGGLMSWLRYRTRSVT
jgi:hypothetical protein